MSLTETIERVSTQHPPTNEQAVNASVVQPILADLGWQIHNPAHVSYEKRIAATAPGHLDIALLGRRQRLAALLVLKAPGSRLESHLSQILRYGPSRTRLCVLTNGIEWAFYLPAANGRPDQRCFLRLRLPDTAEHSPALGVVAANFQRYLSRYALLSHSAVIIAKAALRSRREHRQVNTELPRLWKQMTDDADPDLVALIKKRAQEKIGIDVSSDAVERTLAGRKPIPMPPMLSKTSGKVWKTTSVGGRKFVCVSAENAIAGKRPNGFVLFGQEHKARVNCEVLVIVAETLYRRHANGFYLRVEPLWGNNKPWISQDHHAFANYRLIAGSQYYIDLTLNVGQQAHRWCELLKAFGYGLDQLTLIYDSD